MVQKIFPFLITTIVVLLLYNQAIFTYFAQDDFFHFKVSQTDNSLLGFLNLFGFHPFAERGISFYRPISREVPFTLFYSIFGLNSLPFRIFQFLIHIINIYLIFLFVQKVFKDKFFSFFVCFFFGITAANVATLYYLAGGLQSLLAATFTLSTLLLFHRYIQTKKLIFKIFSFVTFLMGIMSHEQAAVIPFLLIGLILISDQSKKIKTYIIDILPYFLADSILVFLEIYRIGISSTEQQYQLVFGIKKTINSLFWYIIWAFGIPETLIDFIQPGFRLNPNLLRYWSNYYVFIFPSFITAILILLVSTVLLFIRKKSLFINKFFIFAIIWFPVGLSPVLLLPLHKSTHYLTISLPAFWIIVGFIIFNFYREFNNKFSKALTGLFVISLIILSTASSLLGKTNYWAAQRGALAEKFIKEIKSEYPILPKGAVIYFKNDPDYPRLTNEWGSSSKQAAIILNGSDALQLLYKDPSLKVYYEDIQTPDLSGQNVYSFIAKIF